MEGANKSLVGQTAIVTGSSSGIGAAIAVAMAADGANVTVNYHKDKAGAEEVAQQIRNLSGEKSVIVVQCNVSKEEEVKMLFHKTIQHFGTVDICVPNSGIQLDHPLHSMPLEDWNKVLDVNLTGQFLCAREAIIEFLKRGLRKGISNSLGKLIHISSVHEKIPWAGHANYAASKGGLYMLMQSICQEYAPQKIRCNSIAPGAIKTDINEDVWGTEEGLEKMLKLIPYKRIGIPEDIGKAAVWLASDASEYINGTTIFVDGGMACYPGFSDNG